MEHTPKSITSEATPLPREPRLPRLRQLVGRVVGRRELSLQDPTPAIEMASAEVPHEDDNYDQEMSAWTQGVSEDLQNLKNASVAHGAAVSKSWSLISKISEGYRMGYDWIGDGKLVRRGIDRRYGSQDQLRLREAQLSKQLRRRKEQLDAAVGYSTVLEFADEIDPSTYRRFIAPPGQLSEAYSLPRPATPTTDPEEAARLLNTLPFVGSEDVATVYSRKHPKIVISGHFDFPAERILGVASFESWAGRGEDTRDSLGGRSLTPNGKGGKDFSPLALSDIERTSRGAITDYAHIGPEKLKEIGSNANILIIQDAAGEYWGIATSDGSHRTAAAKLRGDKTVAISSIEIASDEDMPRLNYSVRARWDE